MSIVTSVVTGLVTGLVTGNVTTPASRSTRSRASADRGQNDYSVMALPTAERRRHEAVIMVEERDPDGVPVTHYRAVDTLGRMVRNSLIDAEWAAAGDRFRRDFHAAQFDPLCAIDLRRARGAGGHEIIIDRVENARQRVFEAMGCLGGMSAPAGSVIWHVVGNETSLRDWALRQVWGGGKSVRHEIATGILIAALGALAGYYHRPRHSAPSRTQPKSGSEPAPNTKSRQGRSRISP